ncbi:MAG: hypothetical protein H7256_09800 [Bdellovibrio sp.]|nr:hypothetical protein [Bdellovibrio sp.]
MSKTPVETYFEFVENVLGIKQVLLDRTVETMADEIAAGTPPHEIQILISVQDLENYSAPEKELLYKMIQALQLKPESYLVIDTAQKTGYLAQHELSFADSPKPSTADLIETYSPRVLISKPALKKAAWTEMQKLLQLI